MAGIESPEVGNLYGVMALDAKEYAYSKDKKRRVHKFTDFAVNLYI